MHDQIKAKFRRSYPLLMHQEDGHSFSMFGLEISAGWFPLVYELFGLLEDLQHHFGEAVSISQVKEKFGSLRIYMSGSNAIADDLDILESAFEFLSIRTCDICGAPGRRKSDDGYWCARCEDHRNQASHEVLRKASEEAQERFLAYERQGVDTSVIVYVEARKSDCDESLGRLTTFVFPDRLVSLEKGLMSRLKVQSFEHREPQFLASVIEELEANGKTIIGITDGSAVGDIIMGRPC